MSHGLTLRNIRMRIETEDPLYFGQKKLKLQGRDLLHLPKAVFKLMELEVLDLSPEREACLDYKLAMVPADIGKLLNLTTLMLDTNDLLQVPAEITLLTNLERLALSNNHLSELPNGIRHLKNLSSLHLANNKFEIFPDEICDITSLKFLDFCDNLIQVLPRTICKLTQLETLLLFINHLSKLPDTIVQMEELRCLWLGNNNIRVLPKGFGYLTKLDWRDRYTSSTLDGNPLISPPLEICRMGPEAIERFQGVGPNIDAKKQASKEADQDNRSKTESRSRTSSDAHRSASEDNRGNQSIRAPTDANRSRASSDAAQRAEASTDQQSAAKISSKEVKPRVKKPNLAGTQPKRQRIPKT
ncbi:malignant fibrous histiocytoma-amplified sequence 1-like protein [Plakobranchus ocellatus]|uniref:Malignant fibrous histiocytoma-amplified sequence 1-like protein n=1 Tax=Plakobranchus ocellatus TaxID=259542 RepID=A0AAV4BP01_9GAST|nr:malignant fibrous histiocytoma-amplified sequence 1-like protein [Plakobranchus ocellatus]